MNGIAPRDSEISEMEPEFAGTVVPVLVKLPCSERSTEARLGNTCAGGGSRTAADITGVCVGDLPLPFAAVPSALDLAENIGVKGLGVSGNSCETPSADRVTSPKEDAIVILYASMSLEFCTALTEFDALRDL